MPLDLIVDSLDSIPEALRGAYVADGDKFKLDVTGVVSESEVAGLKSALQKERGSRGAAEKQIKAWQNLGKTPEEIADLLAAQAEAERLAAEKSGDHAKILKQHQDRWAAEKAALESELNASRASERGAVVGERLLGALTKAGVTDEGAELLPDRLAGRIKFETVDGKRVLKIMAADGETPMAGKGADGSATLDDLVAEAVTKYPSLFKGSGAGGSGKPPMPGSGGSGVTKKSDFKSERERAAWVDANGMAAYNALPDR
jgi:hypothetical protein